MSKKLFVLIEMTEEEYEKHREKFFLLSEKLKSPVTTAEHPGYIIQHLAIGTMGGNSWTELEIMETAFAMLSSFWKKYGMDGLSRKRKMLEELMDKANNMRTEEDAQGVLKEIDKVRKEWDHA